MAAHRLTTGHNLVTFVGGTGTDGRKDASQLSPNTRCPAARAVPRRSGGLTCCGTTTSPSRAHTLAPQPRIAPTRHTTAAKTRAVL